MGRSFWLACVLALGLGAVQYSAVARDGRIFSLRGAATINGAPMRRSSAVNGGDRIETQAASRVKIMMNDGTVLDIGPDTTFKVDKFAYRKEEPSSWTSGFSLLRGAMRYVSGLIAQNDPRKVRIGVGMATIGIRGSFESISFDGTTLTVDTDIGEATITFPPSTAFPNGRTVNIPTNRRGTVDVGTGRSSVAALPVTSSSVTAAARAIAAAPDDAAVVSKAMAGKSNEEQALVLAVLLNNADHLGVTDKAALTRAVGHAAGANNANAALLVFVASTLDPANADGYVKQASLAAPGETTRIEGAAVLGVDKDADMPDSGVGNSQSDTTDDTQNDDQNDDQGTDSKAENPATASPDTEPGQVPSPTTP